jgi:hypothetical protein
LQKANAPLPFPDQLFPLHQTKIRSHQEGSFGSTETKPVIIQNIRKWTISWNEEKKKKIIKRFKQERKGDQATKKDIKAV